MKRVELDMTEAYKYKLIKQLVDNKGNKKAVAVKLQCEERTVNRLIAKYKQEGKAGFKHKNKGRSPINKISDTLRQKISELYKNNYNTANIRHFCEILKEDHSIIVSDTTVRKILYDEKILSPKAHRKTRKKMRKQIREEIKNAKSKKKHNELVILHEEIETQKTHPRKPRKKYAGESIQMDASSIEWVQNQVWHLHLSIDDATGIVPGAYFDWQETLNGYYHVLYQILKNYGIPAQFYTDNKSVFIFKCSKNKEATSFVQFNYACKQLGISTDSTSIPQSKGRIERLNQSFQSRLPIELKRAGITSIEEANAFLPGYLEKYNNQFALKLNKNMSVYEKAPDEETINTTLATVVKRKIDPGYHIKFEKNYYSIRDEIGIQHFPKCGTDCLVIKAFDGRLFTSVNDKMYVMEELDEHEKLSREFDNVKIKANKKKKWIPPMSHPWRVNSYDTYLSRLEREKKYAHVL